MAANRGQMAALLLGLSAAMALLGLAHANGLRDAVNINNGCNRDFNTTLQTLYTSKGDTTCAQLIYTAFDETNKAKCPPTTRGSPVHLCLNKNGTTAYPDAWSNLIRRCEYMYIANRQGSSESESGFTYNDDSCFQRFNSWGDFSSYLYDSSPYGGSTSAGSGSGAGSPPGGATIAQTAASVVLGAMLLALALVWA